MLSNLKGFAQEYSPRVRQISIQDGLSDRFVNNIFQDSRGFIWLSCNYGLNRYDGRKFKVYTKETHGLKSNEVKKVYEINDTLLLVTHEFKWSKSKLQFETLFSLFNPLTEKVLSPKNVFSFPTGFDFNKVQVATHSLIVDSRNIVYAYSGKGPNAFVLRSIDTLPDKLQDLHYSKLHPDNYWILCSSEDGRSRCIYHYENGSLKRCVKLLEAAEKRMSSYSVLYVDLIGNLYYSGNDLTSEIIEMFDLDFRKAANFYTFKVDTFGNITPFSLKNRPSAVDYYHDAEARIIFLEELGICVVPTEERFDVFDLKGNFLYRTEQLLPYLDIRSFYVDASNHVWLGMTDGVYLIDFNPNIFNPIFSKKGLDPFATPGANGNPLRGICEDDQGNLWIALDLGNGDDPLVKMDEFGNIEPVKNFTETQLNFFKDNKTVPSYAIIKDGKGMLWVTDDHYGLYQVNPKNDEVKFFTYPEYSKNGTNTGYNSGRPFANRAIYIDESDNKVWIGHSNGLSFLSSNSNNLEEYQDSLFKKAIGEGVVHCFYKNKTGLWIGTTNGLFCFQIKTGAFKHYHPNHKDDTFFPNFVVSHIYEDKKGDFWMASKGGEGLLRWNPSTKEYKQYTTEDGLPHNVTYCVYQDDSGDLWSSTNFGIFKLNPKEETVNVYLPKDGLPHIEFNLLSHFKAKDATLYFGGMNGIAAINPNLIQKDARVSKVKLQPISFSLLDRISGNYLDKTAEFILNPKIQLTGKFQAFRIEFALLDYLAPDQIRYSYQIVGYDKNWNYIDNNRISIANLPYGHYTLYIKGRGVGGVWSQSELVIPINVPRPYYFQWWFILLIFFIVSGVIWGIIEYRLRSLRVAQELLEEEVATRTEKIAEQAEDLKALDKLKSRFFANISHELRTPLTLVLGPLRRIRSQKPPESIDRQLSVMERNGRKLLGLVEEILDLSKLEAHKLEVKEESTELFSFLRRVFSSYESAAAYKAIRLAFVTEEEEEQRLLFDKKKLEKILDNLLSNALKFTHKGGLITMTVTFQTNSINVSVSDTGEGVHPEDLPHIFDRFYQSRLPEEKAQGGTGIGLALSKELAVVMGGRLQVKSDFGKGSIFTLEFPKKQSVVESIIDNTASLIESTNIDNEELLYNIPTLGPDTNLNVLIVEDHPDMQEFIQSIIGEHYQTLLADNGQEALDILEREPIDFIISDVMMPVMDGFQLLDQLKKDDRYRHIPVLMLTARAATEDRLHALRIGVDDYLTKPFIAEELIARVQNLLFNYQERIRWAQGLPSLADESEEEETTLEPEPEAELETTTGVQITEEDQTWLRELEEFVKKTCGNNNFSVDWLAAEINISARQLQRRLKKITGLTPKKYINEVRLQLARELLETRKYNTIAQVVYHVGFQKTRYFTQLFVARFGQTPSQYLENI